MWELHFKADKNVVPSQILRGHLTPILSVEKENYEQSSSLFYSGGLDGSLKAWKGTPYESAKSRCPKYEQIACLKVSSEPIWEISSSALAVALFAYPAIIFNIKLRFCQAVEFNYWLQRQTYRAISVQIRSESHRHSNLNIMD